MTRWPRRLPYLDVPRDVGRTVMKGVLCPAVLLPAEMAQAREITFTAKPSVSRAADGVRIAFSVSAPTDVEMAVLDQDGTVVRHLAAGVLGGNHPPPPPLKKGLTQTLQWDGKDDYGNEAHGAAFQVRGRAGLGVNLERPQRALLNPS